VNLSTHRRNVRFGDLRDDYLADLLCIGRVSAMLHVAVPALTHAHVVLDHSLIGAYEVLLETVLVTGAAHLGAGRPLAKDLVLLADKALVVSVHGDRRALDATELVGDKNRPSPDHVAKVDALFRSPSAPSTNLAVLRAIVGVAGLGFDEVRADVTGMLAVLNNVASTLLVAGATTVTARAPVAVRTDDAVDRARARSALNLLVKLWACLAASEGDVDDLSVSVLVAAFTTASAAIRPRGKHADFTVNGANMAVAEVLVLGDGAGEAAENRLDEDLARAGASTFAAGLRASGPRGPLAHLAVLRAVPGPAVDSFGERGADGTVVLGVPEDGTVAGGSAVAAGRGARHVNGPGGNPAVNGARATLTWFAFDEMRANRAVVHGSLNDSTGAGHGALAARNGALTVDGPNANRTIDGAFFLQAFSLLHEVGAEVAAGARSNDDVALTLLGADSA